MNYRHIFHAGNFGDAVKHALLIPLLRGMQRKESGFLYLDVHAGTASYDLEADAAQRTKEFATGIGRLWTASIAHPAIREYVEIVRAFNRAQGASNGSLHYYPGSPAIVARLRRKQDRLALSELHPDDFESLLRFFAGERNVSAQQIDAYSAMRAHLPPKERRALILIDPPYEDPNEAARIHAALADALRRFPSGCYVVWFPIKNGFAAAAFTAHLDTLPLPPTFVVELTLTAGDGSERLAGCGLVVLNPPWQIETELERIAAELASLLARDDTASHRAFWLQTEAPSGRRAKQRDR